jgi:hypothetical protein
MKVMRCSDWFEAPGKGEATREVRNEEKTNKNGKGRKPNETEQNGLKPKDENTGKRMASLHSRQN